jgi:hypothetical protein
VHNGNPPGYWHRYKEITGPQCVPWCEIEEMSQRKMRKHTKKQMPRHALPIDEKKKKKKKQKDKMQSISLP